MADFSADMDKAEGNQLALAGQRLQAQQAQQGMADDQAARQASMQAGGDTNKLVQLLQSGGNYKAAQAIQKAQFDAQKVQADTRLATSHAGNFDAKTATETADAQYKAHDENLKKLQGVSTPDEMMQWIRQGIGGGGLDLSKGAALAQQLQADPGQFQALRDKMISTGVSIQERAKIDAENARNAATNATSVANNTATNATSRANNTDTNTTSRANNSDTNRTHVQTTGMSNAVTMRGQNMTDERTRESTVATMTKPFEVTGPDGLPQLVQQDRQGNITPVQGFGPKAGANKPLNDSQAKALGYGTRMQESDKIIGSLAGQYSPAAVNAKVTADSVPLIGGITGPVANAMLSDKGQQAEQAQRDFINAVLRRESGAAISPSEFENARRQYFPQPNDKPGNLAQKTADRKLAMEGVLAEVPVGQRGSIGPGKTAPAANAAPKAINFGDLK